MDPDGDNELIADKHVLEIASSVMLTMTNTQGHLLRMVSVLPPKHNTRRRYIYIYYAGIMLGLSHILMMTDDDR